MQTAGTTVPPLSHRWHSSHTFRHDLEPEATLKADSHIACRAAEGLECVFPI
jgi:hypothetical protein